ncbi:hypothetical protein X749_19055 [Mesorhizobium sp. LNJC391B00]|nr:hypothetical protein X749_19055 [Mesorhizobium sp. LNJC391B00]
MLLARGTLKRGAPLFAQPAAYEFSFWADFDTGKEAQCTSPLKQAERKRHASQKNPDADR